MPEPVDRLEARPDGASVLITCEHASVRLPDPWAWSEDDRWLVGTHWSYDIGAAELAEGLAVATGASAVLSRFTRLLCDPNRPEHDPTLFREVAEGRAIALNQDLSDAERERRLQRYYRPYHAAVDDALHRRPVPLLLAVHSFTPVYEGHRRDLEVGVLFDRDEDLAEAMARRLRAAGLVVRLNEPYSGREGLIYAADRHARAHGAACVELELRQDLAADPRWRSEVLAVIAGSLRALGF